MTATDGLTTVAPARKPGLLASWWRRRTAQRRRVDYAVWDLRERYGDAAYKIACASAQQPASFERRRILAQGRRAAAASRVIVYSRHAINTPANARFREIKRTSTCDQHL